MRPPSVQRYWPASLALVWACFTFGCSDATSSSNPTGSSSVEPSVRTAGSSNVTAKEPANTADAGQPTTEDSPQRVEADDPPKTGTVEPVAAAQAATAGEAVQLIDLRNFPKLNDKRAMDGSATHVWYMSQASVAAASAYYKTELATHGWEEVKKETESPPSAEYSDVLFSKDGFYVRLSIGATGDEGIVSINLTNNGNVNATQLPKPPDAVEIPVNPTNANYRTTADMATVVESCRNDLTKLGWKEYSSFEPDPTEVAHHKQLRFLKNAVRLDISIIDVSDNPAPQFANAKTHVAYMLTGMLDYDLPTKADATKMVFDTHPSRMRYHSPDGIAEVAEFYRSAYPKLGWKEHADGGSVNEKSAQLIFSGPDDLHVLLDLRQSDSGETIVLLSQVTLQRAPDQPRQTVASTEPAKSEPGAKSTSPDNEPRTRKRGDALGDTLAVPTDAKGVTRDSDAAMVSFASDDDVKKVAEFYRKTFVSLGWREVKLGSVVQNEFASLTFEKGDDTLMVAVLDGKPESRTRTIIQGDSLWPSSQAEPATPPPSSGKRKDEPRPAQVKAKKEHEKLPNRGSLKAGDNTYALENAVAYHTQYASEDVTAIILTEKPVPPTKLKASLKKNPPSDDFASFQPQVKLVFDESDKLIYYFLYADGLSINRGGTPDPDEVSVQATIGDGYASGKVAMKKPGEFFSKNYQFEVTFYAKIENAGESPAADSDAAPGELVAEEIDGLPIPDNNSNRSSQGSKYRKSIQTTVPAELKAVLEFYRRELGSRGWKEDSKAAAVEPEQAKLSFTGDDGELSVQLERQGKSVAINLTVRYTARAKADGLLPKPNQARLILGNISEKDVVIQVNKKEHKVAAGAGAKDPKDGIIVDLPPGKCTVTVKVRGKPDDTQELNLEPATTWGVVVLPTDESLIDQLF
jgi:hypothetical protein